MGETLIVAVLAGLVVYAITRNPANPNSTVLYGSPGVNPYGPPSPGTLGYQPGAGQSGYQPGINYTGLGSSIASGGISAAGSAGALTGAAVPIAGAAVAGLSAILGMIQQHHQQAVQREASVTNNAVKFIYDRYTMLFKAAQAAQQEVGVYYSDLGGPSDHNFPGIGGDGADSHWPDGTWDNLFTQVDTAYSDWTNLIQPIRKSGNGPDVVDRTWIQPMQKDFKFVLQKMSHGVHGNTAQSGGYLPAIPDHAGFLGAQRVDFQY